MVTLRKILACLVLALMLPVTAIAETGKTAVEREMAKQGYDVIYSETTWLGRLRLLAIKGDLLREVVIGPGTGEVLRDVAYEIPGLAQQVAQARAGNNGGRIVALEGIGASGSVEIAPNQPLAVAPITPATVDPEKPLAIEQSNTVVTDLGNPVTSEPGNTSVNETSSFAAGVQATQEPPVVGLDFLPSHQEISE